MSDASPTELSVQSLPVQTLYSYYRTDRFQVNRRYQRKLVWNVEEKQRLIDSLLKGLPIPLLLVAELGTPPESPYELIDGMQRLNAIFSFLENEYTVDGHYFDLDALADTKSLKDDGSLEQRQPVMDRQSSVRVANYTVALSVFRAKDVARVDDVFRRINSSGRRLSRQELRQAGTTSRLADIVRIISSRIRTDTSPSDVVPLHMMPHLSITNKELPYGVNSETIFWVVNGILRREEVRSSIDEQVVLDLLLDCVLDPMPNSGTRIRDRYYNFSEDDDSAEAESTRITNVLEIYGLKTLEDNFMKAYDEIREVLTVSGQKFTNLIDTGSGGRSPRAFHVIFLAFFELMFKEQLRLADRQAAAAKLKGTGEKLEISPRGGDWPSAGKRKAIDSVKGIIRDAFEPASTTDDHSSHGWASQFETLLNNAVLEQPLFDCKQGLLRLDAKRPFDDSAFDKICRSLTAMANQGPGAVGHIVLGVADDEADAERVRKLDGVTAQRYKNFHVVGLEREALARSQSLNDYYAWLMQKISGNTRFDDPTLAGMIANQSKVFNYHGRTVVALRVEGQKNPFFYNKELVDRKGSDTVAIPQGGSGFMSIFSRFS